MDFKYSTPADIPKPEPVQILKVFPENLFRAFTRSHIRLDEFHRMRLKGEYSYDYVATEEGLINPYDGTSAPPNGLVLKPLGFDLCEQTAKFRKNARVQMIPAGTRVTEDLQLVKYSSGVYCLETIVTRDVISLDVVLSRFVHQFEIMSRKEFFSRYFINGKLKTPTL